MNYSAEDEAKILAVMADTDCSREVAIKYLDGAKWHVHGALCDFGHDQCAESAQQGMDDGFFDEEF